MSKLLIAGLLIIVWAIVMRALYKADLSFWSFIIGGAGLFVFLFVTVQPILTEPLARVVALIASIPGKIGNTYSAYYKFGTIFIDSAAGAISLKIDFECSGIIEILAFLSLLCFFRVYTATERIFVGILGIIYIILANALRIVTICFMIHFGGVRVYYIAHTFVGRLVFYGLSVVLYFYVFTKPQIIKQKVGSFSYDNN